MRTVANTLAVFILMIFCGCSDIDHRKDTEPVYKTWVGKNGHVYESWDFDAKHK